MHTTNYYNTFIQIADDSPTTLAEVPAVKNDKQTIASIQFNMLIDEPYVYTSDDVVFGTYALKNGISKANEADERETFFSKGQACLRASPLTKRYGWGVHSNAEGKIAIYAAGTAEYNKMAEDDSLKQLKAMRSKRA